MKRNMELKDISKLEPWKSGEHIRFECNNGLFWQALLKKFEEGAPIFNKGNIVTATHKGTGRTFSFIVERNEDPGQYRVFIYQDQLNGTSSRVVTPIVRTALALAPQQFCYYLLTAEIKKNKIINQDVPIMNKALKDEESNDVIDVTVHVPVSIELEPVTNKMLDRRSAHISIVNQGMERSIINMIGHFDVELKKDDHLSLKQGFYTSPTGFYTFGTEEERIELLKRMKSFITEYGDNIDPSFKDRSLVAMRHDLPPIYFSGQKTYINLFPVLAIPNKNKRKVTIEKSISMSLALNYSKMLALALNMIAGPIVQEHATTVILP